MPAAVLALVGALGLGLAGFPATNAGAAETPGLALPAESAAWAANPFSPAQLDVVSRWIREQVPACPAEVTRSVAQKFLEDLKQRDPGALEQVLTLDLSARRHQSTIFRLLGAELNGGPQAALREEIMRRRVAAVLELDAPAAGTPAALAREADRLVGKIKDLSSVYHRRLLEGRTDDDDLRLLMKKVRQADAGGKPVEPAKPKTLTAAEIVSAFARQNQEGTAVQRLRSYTLEGRMTTPQGEEQPIMLFRLRPDRFRLVVGSKGETRYVLSFDGERTWQQAPGRPPLVIRRESVGAQRYLAEFLDPLFGEAGATFERLEDVTVQGKPAFRLAVRRPDGSRYIARIDLESYRQVGRENEDKSIATYSEFRDVAGVMIAFREEVTDAQGRKSVLELNRFTPNPALIQAFFVPPPATSPDFFALERMTRANALLPSKP